MTELIEPGVYSATLVDVSVGESDSGTPFVVVQWLLETGQRRSVYFYLSTAAREMAGKALRYLEFNGDFMENPDCGKKSASLLCSHEEFQGKMKEQWSLAAFANSYKKPEEKTLSELDNWFSGVPF